MGAIEGIVALYGPAVVFIGTFFEGETVVVVAGFLAHQGVLNPFVVAACAAVGSFAGDQLWFFLGRRHASHPLVVRVTQRPLFRKAAAAIDTHPRKFILSFRFIYGIRTISPVAVALTGVPTRTFLLLNAVSAVVWAVCFTSIGYFFGKAAEAFLGKMTSIEHKVLVAVACAAAVFAIYQIVRVIRSRSRRKAP